MAVTKEKKTRMGDCCCIVTATTWRVWERLRDGEIQQKQKKGENVKLWGFPWSCEARRRGTQPLEEALSTELGPGPNVRRRVRQGLLRTPQAGSARKDPRPAGGGGARKRATTMRFIPPL